MEQLVARRAHNPKAVGPNPTPATKWFRSAVVNTSACHAEDRGFKSLRNRHFFIIGSVAQSVEHRTENPGVDSSILSGATIFKKKGSYALVAQLDRVFGYEPKGREFESLRAHHFSGSGSTW